MVKKLTIKLNNKQYNRWLACLKLSIGKARFQTSLQVNANMLFVYWFIGNQLLQKVEKEKWGSGVAKQLADDLQKSFPDTKGFSERNLKYMRQFAGVYPDITIGQEPLAQMQNSKKPLKQLSINTANQLVYQSIKDFLKKYANNCPALLNCGAYSIK